jgi:5-(carboxyamino)imidazole ribonucleotide mutase
MKYKIAFLIGSESDRMIVESSVPYFNYFKLHLDLFVMSAHRNPKKVSDFASSARNNGYSLIVCGAGMAAHLAGAIKANTSLPVIGVPLPGGMMDGLDSLLSTVQMPKGVPVATMSVGKSGAINAAIFCAEVLSLNDGDLVAKLSEFKNNGAKISD